MFNVSPAETVNARVLILPVKLTVAPPPPVVAAKDKLPFLMLTTEPEPPPSQFNVKSSRLALAEDPEFKRAKYVRRIEFLQDLLLRVERYRLTRVSQSDTNLPHVPSQ